MIVVDSTVGLAELRLDGGGYGRWCDNGIWRRIWAWLSSIFFLGFGLRSKRVKSGFINSWNFFFFESITITDSFFFFFFAKAIVSKIVHCSVKIGSKFEFILRCYFSFFIRPLTHFSFFFFAKAIISKIVRCSVKIGSKFEFILRC